MRPHASESIQGLSVNSPFYLMPAIRGIQAGREYYVAMMPLRLIPRVFVFDEDELPAELRAQRSLNRTRVPEIARYLTENPRDYTFSSITASVDGDMKFMPQGPPESDVGMLQVPMNARIIINDGQHRRAAIEEALHERPELGIETLSVVLFQDAGLHRCQQMFADLNRHAIRPTKSLGILYDGRDDFSRMALEVIRNVPVFASYTDLEKTTISNRSTKLFTLNAIYTSSRVLLNKTSKHSKLESKDTATATAFWRAVCDAMPEWQLMAEKKIAPAELRREYIHSHGVALQAIAHAGAALLSLHSKDWKQRIQKLQTLDWRRANHKQWEGRATIGGKLSKRQENITLTANAIKRALGLPLAGDEEALERGLARQREVLRA